MKNHKFLGLFVFLALAAFSLSGCGDANKESAASVYPHPAGWVAASDSTHPAAYRANQDVCVECHGSDLGDPAGGISKVSCSSCHPWPYGHPDGWYDPANHGSAAKAATPGLASCKTCHGSSFTGGSAQSCMTSNCHLSSPHSPAPWFGGTYTHSNTDISNAPACAACHTNGANLSQSAKDKLPLNATIGDTGCFNNTLCHGVLGHDNDPQPWRDADKHGARAKLNPSTGGNGGFNACQQCHGTAFDTDRGGVTCFTCHTTSPHPTAAIWRAVGTTTKPSTHTTTGADNAPVCASCHNTTTPNLATPFSEWFTNSPAGSFNGTAPGCYNASMCHGNVETSCDACHSTAATVPFKSMSGETATTDVKVGAHVKHLSTATLSANVSCSECHTVPTSALAAGTHRNNANDIVFGTLAKTGTLTPTYTAATGVCANTYCHGTTLSGGTNKSPIWNQTGYNAGCGTCHGFPPPAPHAQSSDCNSCHSSNIHINGSLEVSGGASHDFPNPGSLHKSAANGTDCIGCHAMGTVASSYPVTAGTAPDCRACHLNANPGTDPQCSDCHGSVANNGNALLAGRPIGGNTFPNRPGQHNRSEHNGSTCKTCHPISTGDDSHGWSGGLPKSTTASVGSTLFDWNTNGTCSNVACHEDNGNYSW